MAGTRVATTPAPTQGPLLLQNPALYQMLSDGDRLAEANGIHLLAEIVNQKYRWRLDNLGDPEQLGPCRALAAEVLEGLAKGVDRDRRSESLCVGNYASADTSHFACSRCWPRGRGRSPRSAGRGGRTTPAWPSPHPRAARLTCDGWLTAAHEAFTVIPTS